MINLEKGKVMVKYFAPKPVTVKKEVFAVQGTILDVEDPNYFIQLRINDGEHLCKMIREEFNLPEDFVQMSEFYGENVLMLNVFTERINFDIEQLDVNHVKVEIYWVNYIYAVEEIDLDKLIRDHRKR